MLTRERVQFFLVTGVALLMVLAGGSLCAANDIYVDASATLGANNGTSWANAYTDLQSALAAAVSGDNIYVAQGTYKPTSGTDRTISFQLKSGVTLQGGYRAADGARDPAYETILSGDIGIPGDNSDNSYHVVNGSGVDNTAVIDGFTITAGNANVWPGDYTSWMGGGMFAGWGSPTLTNMTFYDNSAEQGAGLDVQGGNPTLTDVTFTGNLAINPGDGGAIYVSSGLATLTNVTISGNTAYDQGGGIYVGSGGRATLTYVTISGNTAGVSGGGWYFYDDNDSCYALDDSCNDPMVRNSILWGNSPDQVDNHRGNAYFSYSVVQDGCPPSALHCMNIITADPMLGTLGDNGGYTQTIPLLAGSSAIDTGFDYGVDYDQRGVTRPQGAGFDIGAYEYVPPLDATPPTTTATPTPSPNGAGWNNANVTVALTATDNPGGSGVKEIHYSLTGATTGGGVVAGSTALVTITGDGITTVTYFATDNAGNQETNKSITIRIDRTPPVISGLPAPGTTLWPPNGKMVKVATATAGDALSGLAYFNVTGSSNEASDPKNPDIVITGSGLGPRTIQLRADRLGTGSGRIYTLTATATDFAGNTITSKAIVIVPHDQGK
jgi:parallel beta-helix repeat protein/predicted outer membrane repeat protein